MNLERKEGHSLGQRIRYGSDVPFWAGGDTGLVRGLAVSMAEERGWGEKPLRA